MNIFYIVAFLLTVEEVFSVSITGLDFHQGSSSGGTTIRIYGSDFAEDSFNFMNPDLGNTVTFNSATKSYYCDVDKDATDENTITCYTRAMDEDMYYVKLNVNGQDVSDGSYCSGNPHAYDCSLQILSSKTPLVSSISPTTSHPGALITLNGQFFTNKTQSADGSSINGNDASIRRIWIGGKKCEMYQGPDELYGVELNYNSGSGTYSNWGSIKCLHAGNFVACQNISLLIDNGYGRAKPMTQIVRVSSDYRLYHYQTYAGINSISPSVGSLHGGTLISVNGSYFDDDSIDVKVGGQNCSVVDRGDTLLTCTAPTSPFTYTDIFPGGRGVIVEIYPGLADASTIDGVSYNDFTGVKAFYKSDDTEISYTASTSPVVVRIQGFFIPPKNGTYAFWSSKTSTTNIYVSTDHTMANKVLFSDGLSLVGGNEYYYEVIHTETTTAVSFRISAYLPETEYVYGQTAWARPERQTIVTTSPDDKEIQSLTLNDWVVNENSTNERFQLCITCAEGRSCNGMEEYNILLDGIATKSLTIDASATEVKEWMDQFSTLGGDTVTVQKIGNSAPCYSLYTIQVDSTRGSLNLQAVPRDDATISTNLTILNASEASRNTFTIAINGIPSPHIPVGDTNAFANAIRSLFSTSCPPAFGMQFGTEVQAFNDFEDANSNAFGGSITFESSFCGLRSLKNPSSFLISFSTPIYLFDDLKACFAYKGQVAFTFSFHYSYYHFDEGFGSSSYNARINDGTNEWQFTCLSILKSIMSKGEPGMEHSLTHLTLTLSSSNTDFYLDNFFLSTVLRTDDEIQILQGLRRLPVSDIRVDDITVVNNGDVYTVTMFPYNCATGLPLIEAAYSTKDENGVYTSDSWGDASITIQRIQPSAPAIGGNFDLTLPGDGVNYGGSVSGIPWNVEANDLELIIEGINGVNDVTISRAGNCRSYTWSLQFESPGGNHAQLQATGNFENGDATISTNSVTEGGLHLDSIPGDWVRSAHPDPQVQVTINNVPSLCSGECSFSRDESSTPTVTDVTISGTDVTITGTKFSSETSGNIVDIGGVSCLVTACTETSIECTLGESPAGTQPLIVNVDGMGYSESYDVDVPIAINTIDPNSGSAIGGTEVTITGQGFSPSIAVQIGDSSCLVSSTTYTTIKCNTTANAVGAQTISLNLGTETNPSAVTFTFIAASAIGTLSPATLTVLGGNLTFTGSGFGDFDSNNAIYIGSEIGQIVSWTESEIVATAPSMSPGSYTVRVNIPPFGDAELTPNQVEYVLSVSGVTPNSVSLLGGLQLTISGQGFDEGLAVVAGGNTCEINSQSSTEIICTMGSCGKTHTVDNTGTGVHGFGYGWNPAKLTIKAGDKVAWSWSEVEGVFGATYQVFSTLSSTSIAYDNNGFTSGSATASGSYVYEFNVPGTYYVGGYANVPRNIFMRGIITVEDAVDTSASLTVRVGNHEAIYEGGGFQIACTIALTPIVTDISPRFGTSDTFINITGTGFSDVASETSVRVGEAECTVESSSLQFIQCKVGVDTELTTGLNQLVTVITEGKGSSRSDIRNLAHRYFALLPHISSVLPTTGSLAGGTRITISGGGLTHTSRVTVGGQQCSVISTTYTTILCETTSSVEGPHSIAVEVFENQQLMDAECISNACSFDYRAEDTPIVTEVTPKNMSAPGTVTITGEGLVGDASTTVKVGTSDCVVQSITDTTITCHVDGLPVGDNLVQVHVAGKGFATTGNTTFSILSIPTISGISTNVGSVLGGAVLTISGNGFVSGSTTVLIGEKQCAISTVTLSTITCVTNPSEPGSYDLVVTSNNLAYDAQNFQYLMEYTPNVTAISPTSGEEGDDIVISISLLSDVEPTVFLGSVPCVVSATNTVSGEITCTLGSRYGGAADIVVTDPKYGIAGVEDGVTFQYSFSVSAVTPTSGSLGGQQTVTISGNGFASESTVKICDQECTVVGTISATSITCTIPAAAEGMTCDIHVINTDTDNRTLANAYTYDPSLTPQVTSVSPPTGGTGGGTVLTISGSGLSGVTVVDIDGSVCDIDTSTVTDTSFQCTTNSHQGAVQAQVKVYVGTNGIAPVENAGFYYVDRWSSIFTWGGTTIPQEGEFIVIQEGAQVLLDTDTAQLSMLLIQGSLIFENEGQVHLRADNILITNGGLLQIGTEEEPYTAQAQITMYGHLRSQELPIYGAKTLGVREGRLEMHGKPIETTWTVLAETANAGATQIKLQIPVDWTVGDEIVIASTGLRHSQSQNEQNEIAAINIVDGKTVITLAAPLQYEHLGVYETYTVDGNDIDFEYTAEVGLLTRNIKFKGSDDISWHDKIERCPDGFDTGQFATQTCFQGRFGEEEGSDEFGGSIMIHSKTPTTDPNNGLAVAHIEYVELNYVGQAYRLGRYPIHWHLMGDMTGNYVRGCAIHQSFNRAVTIHGTHNLLVERNVVYNVMGGALFIEDGIETGNILQYNLAVFVRQSTSLLNDDITPAAYWVTNPDNIIRHNHAAGGTHFGYWYRMHTHPDGPSFTPTVCQQNVELGVFLNNSAHSQGWYGLWIFQTYTPKLGGGCGSNTPMAAKFDALKVWHCEKGAETVNGGAIQYHNFKLSSNEKLAIDIHAIIGTTYNKGDRGALVKDCIIIGHANFWDSSGYETSGGIAMPGNPGMWVDGATFININKGTNVAFIISPCNSCGGFYYWVENLKFSDVNIRIKWSWEHQAVILDLDGSFSDLVPDTKVVPYSALYGNGTDCVLSTDRKFGAGAGVSSMICEPSVRFHRFAFNGMSPESISQKSVIFKNQYGNSTTAWSFKRATHMMGWMVLLKGRETYEMSLQNTQLVNISFNGALYDFIGDDHVIIKMEMHQKPDRIAVTGNPGRVENTTMLTALSNNRDWHYDVETAEFFFKVGRPDNSSSRSDFSISPNLFRCIFPDCIYPVDTGSLPDVENPDGAILNVTDFTPHECFIVEGDSDEDRVIGIPGNCWVYWAIPNAVVHRLHIVGNMYFDPSIDNITLTATFIIVEGRLIAGRHYSDPHIKPLHIILRGNSTTEDFVMNNAAVIGPKTFACFGVCDLHGLQIPTVWTSLAQTATADSQNITLDTPVTWNIGDEIVITPTGFNANHTEKLKISDISSDGKTVTFEQALQHDHTAQVHDFGQAVDLTAKVGLLTRSIKIEGEHYEDMEEDAFGGRVLVSTTGTYTAKIRFSYVEFYHSGQEEDSWDPRNSIGFFNAGLGSEIFHCAFHHGFSPAIGTFRTNAVNITGNVIHHTLGDGLTITGTAHTLNSNLIVLNLFPGSYLNRLKKDSQYTAAINIEGGYYIKMYDNVVAGAERCAYKVSGQPCEEPVVPYWSGNAGHASLVGVYHMGSSGGCSILNGFTISKAWDYGIYHQTSDSVEIRNSAIIDATVGYLPVITGPAALSHQFQNKTAKITSSLVVGRSDQTDCTTDMNENTDKSLIIRRIAGMSQQAPRTPTGGRSAFMLPMFASAANGAPKKAFTANKKYPALYGLLDIVDVTVVNFGTVCSGTTDVLFFTNPSNEDATHPTYVQGLIQNNVEINSFAYIARPNAGKINPSDCVDMFCDSKLKVLIRDMDGSLFGWTGSIISQAEYGWGSQRFGIGDFRIPKTMLTMTNGTRIPVDSLVPDKGIARTDACGYNSKWQAYECSGADAMDYLMLVIESLDSDSETRRLSPVALKVGTYIDLNNGPQDHGWCSGYTCQKRISTFYTIVPVGQLIELFFTSTPPQRTRFHLLNSNENETIVIGVWIPNPQKLDVHNSTSDYIRPTNAYDGADGRMRLEKPPASDPDKFKPNPATANPGDNYLDFDTRVLYICVGGKSPVVTIITRATIIVSFGFPAITLNEFFEDNIVVYLAALLKIDQSKIRHVEVVRETSERKKRSTESTASFEIEADTPEEANQARASIMDEYQRETMVINGEIPISLSTTSATTNDSIPEMDAILASDDPFNNRDVITVPKKMSVITVPAGHEKTILTTSPVVHLLDADDNHVITSPTWTVTVSLDLSHPNADNSATVGGTTTLSFVKGVAQFNDLVVSHSGIYRLVFTSTQSTISQVMSDEFTLGERTIGAQITRIDETGLITEGEELKFELQLTNASGGALEDVNFKGYTYKIDLEFDDPSEYGDAVLSGTTTFTFDATGSLTTTGVSLTGTTKYLVYNLKFSLYTNPPSSYTMTVGTEKIQIYPDDSTEYMHEDASNQKNLELVFTNDYDSTLGTTETATFETGFYNVFAPLHTKVYIAPFSVEKTSTDKVQFTTIVTGKKTSDVTEFLDGLTTAGNLQSRGGTITLDSACGVVVNGNCYQSTTATTTTSSTATAVLVIVGGNHGVIIYSTLGACAVLALCIVAATYLVKRYQVAKVGLMTCTDSTSLSQCRLKDPLDDFRHESEGSSSRSSSDGVIEQTPVIPF